MLARLDVLCSGVALPVCSNSADQIQLLFTTGAKKRKLTLWEIRKEGVQKG